MIFLHGGPGAGCDAVHACFFDPRRYRIVLFDQRGAGRSTPPGECRNNTTWNLVDDIERIREHLGVSRWLVFGGSWGSTLALAYAQAHPANVLGMILRGIFLGTREEVAWFSQGRGMASAIFPERWDRYASFIPPEERDDMVEAYWLRLGSTDDTTRRSAALAWAAWEGGCSTLLHDPQAATKYDDDPARALRLARLETHYFREGAFLKEGQLLRDIARIRHLPATIVHGRYDMLCPVSTAIALSKAWPEATLQIVLSGHSAFDPATIDALVSATDAMAARLRQ